MAKFQLGLGIPKTYPYVKFELNVLYRWGDNKQKLKVSYYFQSERGITVQKIIEP
jgi:hypothetical protein